MHGAIGHAETAEEALVRLMNPATAMDGLFANYVGEQGVYYGCVIDAPWDPAEVEPEEEDGNSWAFEIQFSAHNPSFYCQTNGDPAPIGPSSKRVEKQPYAKKPIHAKLRWAVFRRDGYRCVLCGCDEDPTADHIVAEVNGGKATISNLQTLCRPCNSKKGAR